MSPRTLPLSPPRGSADAGPQVEKPGMRPAALHPKPRALRAPETQPAWAASSEGTGWLPWPQRTRLLPEGKRKGCRLLPSFWGRRASTARVVRAPQPRPCGLAAAGQRCARSLPAWAASPSGSPRPSPSVPALSQVPALCGAGDDQGGGTARPQPKVKGAVSSGAGKAYGLFAGARPSLQVCECVSFPPLLTLAPVPPDLGLLFVSLGPAARVSQDCVDIALGTETRIPVAVGCG